MGSELWQKHLQVEFVLESFQASLNCMTLWSSAKAANWSLQTWYPIRKCNCELVHALTVHRRLQKLKQISKTLTMQASCNMFDLKLYCEADIL